MVAFSRKNIIKYLELFPNNLNKKGRHALKMGDTNSTNELLDLIFKREENMA